MADPLAKFDLRERVAVVTGATEGIGRGLALGLAEAGADVVVCSRREDALRDVQAEIAGAGRRSPVGFARSRSQQRHTPRIDCKE